MNRFTKQTASYWKQLGSVVRNEFRTIPVVGSEQGGVRPVLIVQNDVVNKFSPTVIAAAITSQRDKANLPTHIEVDTGSSGLMKDSVVLLEQVRTIDKHRLKEKMGKLDENSMNRVNEALSISFGLPT